MSLWEKDHPIWKLLQQLLGIAGALILLSHGIDTSHAAGPDGADWLGGAWIFRELLRYWRKPSSNEGDV